MDFADYKGGAAGAYGGSSSESSKTIREAFVEASSFLKRHGVEEAGLNAELLLQHLLGWSRTQLLTSWQDPFPEDLELQWQKLLGRRGAGEPLQYVVGEEGFYGLTFRVNPAVLIPRPETEILVQEIMARGRRIWGSGAAKGAGVAGAGEATGAAGAAGAGGAESSLAGGKAAEGAVGSTNGAGLGSLTEGTGTVVGGGPSGDRPYGPLLVDIGTGSGAIPVTVAVKCPGWRVSAVDISPAALEVARENAALNGLAEERIRFYEGDLLQPLIEAGVQVDILVSNPPYIPSEDLYDLQREVRDYEPRLALDGGPDGLEFYRRLVSGLRQLPQVPRLVGFEVGMGQAGDVAAMLRATGAFQTVDIVRDLAGIDRHVLAEA